MNFFTRWKHRARAVRLEACTLYLACRDPRMPWTTRLLALGIVAYALSPIDLIPDWIPIFGYLDDLLLIPLGITLVMRLTPPALMEDCRERARDLMDNKPVNRTAAAIIIAIWLLSFAAMTMYLIHAFSA